MALTNGSIISDRYQLVKLIATGGMGQVWEAFDRRLDRKVAIKVLKAEYSNNEEFINRFRVEAKTTAGLNNAGIAGVFDYGETHDEVEGSLAYLVMELVDGQPLSAILNKKKTLSVDTTLDILEQTAVALHAAHNIGLVHRDVKPGNILLTDAGEVKITDFGIAKAADAAPLTQTGTVMGTAQYISPEQALGNDATSASDVYALAVVGYEALCGKRPFLGDSPISIAMQHINDEPPPLPDNVPLAVKNLLRHALEKDPSKRYKNGLEFSRAIRKVKIGFNVPTPPQLESTGTPELSGKKSKPTSFKESIARALPTHTGTLEASVKANSELAAELEPEELFISEAENNEGKTRIIIAASLSILLLLAAIAIVILFMRSHRNDHPHNTDISPTPQPPKFTIITTTTPSPTHIQPHHPSHPPVKPAPRPAPVKPAPKPAPRPAPAPAPAPRPAPVKPAPKPAPRPAPAPAPAPRPAPVKPAPKPAPIPTFRPTFEPSAQNPGANSIPPGEEPTRTFNSNG